MSWGVAIITCNNESTIEMVLDSLRGVDQVVVVDSGSTDRTPSICEQKGVSIIHKAWEGYSKQKQFAVDQLKTEWVLSLDSDEVLSPALFEEITKITNTESVSSGFEIPRLMVFMGKKLRYGKGVDYPVRLFRRGSAKFDGREIHEKIVVEGELSRLKNPIYHYSTRGVSERLSTILRDVRAEKKYCMKYEPNLIETFWIPLKFFVVQTLLKGAWKDGLAGIINVSCYALQHFLQRSAMFWWKFNERSEKSNPKNDN